MDTANARPVQTISPILGKTPKKLVVFSDQTTKRGQEGGGVNPLNNKEKKKHFFKSIYE